MDSVEGLFRGWYDVLRTYDGKGIQYDRSGNPVSYDGKTFTWNGRLLTKVTAADGSCTEFAYDANGIRTQKRQFAPDGTLEYFVDYVWQDGLLTHQNMTFFLRVTVNGETRVAEIPFSAKILYDENDTPVGSMVSDEGAVGYVRNLQGDIVALVSPEGEVLVEYSYDPWGNVTVSHGGEAVEGLEAAIVAVFCPFAYRGYNYDFTTGLYYLQSRYYNPEWGRFLNVDDTNILLASQGESLGANLFAYCGNNPVNMVDYMGRLPTGLDNNELFTYAMVFLECYYAIEKSEISNILFLEVFDFEYTQNQYGIFVCNLVFYDKTTVYQCVKVMIGEQNSWLNYGQDNENVPRSDQYVASQIQKQKNRIDQFIVENFGTQAKMREQKYGNLVAVYLTIREKFLGSVAAYLFEASNNRRKHSTYYGNALYLPYDAKGMVAVSKKYFHISKYGVNRFMNNISIPKFSDVVHIENIY